MSLISNRPKGSNITIMNTTYKGPSKQEDGKYDNGYIDILYKDLDNGNKYVETIEDPDYTFYKLKDGYSLDYNALFIEKDKVEPVSVPYRNLEYSIAELTDNVNFYRENIRNGNRRENKKLHTLTNIFGSDTHIEDHYRYRFSKEYKNEPFTPSKAYLDIEVDIIDLNGEFPEPGECEVNAVSIINDVNNTIYTLLLRNERNPLIQKFEDNIDNDFFKRLRGVVVDAIGGWKQEIRYGLDKFKYEIMFYDEEINLIADVFKIINISKPDFVLAWNMAFDIPYLIERIKVLGYSPEDIICHPDFKHKRCYYMIEPEIQEKHRRGDYYAISSYSVYLDQMLNYAARRGDKAKIVNLDYIGSKIVGVRKLDYSHISPNLAKLPYRDYELFVFYNIIDTIVQKCIELKVNDVDYLFTKCVLNHVRYHKAARQTVYLVDGAIEGFEKDGLILGNNVNKFKDKPTTKYPGAYVASTQKLNDYSKMKVNGNPVSLFNNLDDFDYASLYPSILREFNMSPNTQIGKIIIDNKIWDEEDPFNYKFYDRGAAFAEDLHSNDYISFCNRWLNLASYRELYDDIIEYIDMNNYKYRMNCNAFVENKLYSPFIPYNNNRSPFNKMRPMCEKDYNIDINNFIFDEFLRGNIDR